MAPRPTWKGYLKLSLVSCAVAMYTATSTSSRIRLNIINRETGNRIRNQAIDSETGDVVENENKVKGYEVDDGQYVLLEEDELDEVALESTHTIDIEVLRAARRRSTKSISTSPSTSCRTTRSPTRRSRSSARR